ncbi:Deoxyuridine 5'-triphosphate nucleotidohydrolase [hydrothermal vent metagenome]|uniref:dUTP diphosphatase n=1 Tax=hydrothermal vent metagenome TaxID=652676 RepID=A0A3B0T8M3_9ZZZZ
MTNNSKANNCQENNCDENNCQENNYEAKIRWLEHGQGLKIQYQSEMAAGIDLVAAIGPDEDLIIAPGERVLIPGGFAMELAKGFEAQIRPRSGLALKHGISVLNSPGTIDGDYRGEIKVLLINMGQYDFHVKRGMRIAQMVIAQVSRVELVTVENLDNTTRASSGFGSTG